MKKKIISSILSLAMLLSLLPGAAFAADTAPATKPGTVVTKDDESVILANYNSDLASTPWTNAKLEITSVTTANAENDTPKTVNISLTVNDLRAHENKEGTRGYWIGIGVPQVTGNTYKTGWGDKSTESTAESNRDDEQTTAGNAKYDTFYWGSDASKLVGTNKQGYIEVTNNDTVTRYVITFNVTVAPAEITEMGFFANADKANTVIGALKGSPLTGVDVCAPDTMYVAVDQLCGPLHNYIATLTGPNNTVLKYHSSTATGANVFDYDDGTSGKYVLYFTFDEDVENGSWVYKDTSTRVGAENGEYTFRLYTLDNSADASATVPSSNAVVIEESITLASVTVKKDTTTANDVVVYFNKDAQGANQVSIADLLGDKTITEPSNTADQSFLGWVINDNDQPISTRTLKTLETKPADSVVYKAKMAQTVNVSFNADDATTGTAPTEIKVAKDGKLTTEQVASIEAATETLDKTGYIFDGWATRSGTEGSYTYNKVDLAAATFSVNATLYAQWKSDKVASASVKEQVSTDWVDSTLIATIGAPAATPTNGKYPVDITISGTVAAMTTNDTANYKLSYTTDKVSNPTPADVTITKTADGLEVGALNLTVGDYIYNIKLDLTELDAKIVPPAAAEAVVDVQAEASTAKNVTSSNIAELTTAISDPATGGTITAADDSVNKALNDVTKALNANDAAAAATELAKLDAEYAKLDNPTSNGYDTKTNYTAVQAVSYLDIQVTDYNLTTNSESITLEITPKIKYQLVSTDDTKKPIDVGAPTENSLTVTTPVTISFKAPQAFTTVSAPSVLYVTHKDAYVYKADKQGDGSYQFNNPNGFSEFVITKTNPAVAQTGTVGSEKFYSTLQSAVDDAVNNTEITILKAGLTPVSVNEAIVLKLKTTDTTNITLAYLKTLLTAGNNVECTVTDNTTDTATFTFTAKAVTPPSGGSTGGGGVSSNVTIDRPSNGKVSVTPTAPSKGATVTINLTPDTGYAVGTVTVTDKDGKTVELTKVNDTQYTFTMPDGKVTVKATFTKVDAPATGFTDVPADAYYADAVKWAVEKGITNGLTATTFGPNNSCTRGQMVTFLWRAAGSPAATGTNSFSDVASGEYYYNAVLWAVEKGITNGTSANTFSPNATVNRGQTVTFLYRYAESPAATGDTSFTDVTADAFYADAVKWAVAEEITNGTSSTTFSPASNCTRGQIVTFMYRQMAE